jgi:plastocyanin
VIITIRFIYYTASHGSIMTSLDKAGMAIAIAITAIFIGIAASMGAVQDTPTNTTPVTSVPTETQTEQFGADIAEKVKSGETIMKEESLEIEDEVSIEATNKKETTMDEPVGPTTHSVDIPKGTSVPGCEESNSCYSPADITINAGDTVEWMNVDTAAHTVTGGSPADGPSGVFDSSLVMASASYAFTFNDAGSYDYFCMVHPWMTGSVSVN